MLNANKWNICFLIIFRSSMAFNGVSLRISSASGRFWTLFVIWIPMFNLHYSNGCLCVRAHVFVYVFAFFARVYSLQNIFNSTIVCRFVYCYWQLQHSSFKYREFRLLKRFLVSRYHWSLLKWAPFFFISNKTHSWCAHIHAMACHQFNVKTIGKWP